MSQARKPFVRLINQVAFPDHCRHGRTSCCHRHGGGITETVAGKTTETWFTPEAQRARFLELAKDPAAVAGGRAMMRRLADINANRIPEPTREDEQSAEVDEQPAAAVG